MDIYYKAFNSSREIVWLTPIESLNVTGYEPDMYRDLAGKKYTSDYVTFIKENGEFVCREG
jgi:hypothetical protein